MSDWSGFQFDFNAKIDPALRAIDEAAAASSSSGPPVMAIFGPPSPPPAVESATPADDQPELIVEIPDTDQVEQQNVASITGSTRDSPDLVLSSPVSAVYTTPSPSDSLVRELRDRAEAEGVGKPDLSEWGGEGDHSGGDDDDNDNSIPQRSTGKRVIKVPRSRKAAARSAQPAIATKAAVPPIQTSQGSTSRAAEGVRDSKEVPAAKVDIKGKGASRPEGHPWNVQQGKSPPKRVCSPKRRSPPRLLESVLKPFLTPPQAKQPLAAGKIPAERQSRSASGQSQSSPLSDASTSRYKPFIGAEWKPVSSPTGPNLTPTREDTSRELDAWNAREAEEKAKEAEATRIAKERTQEEADRRRREREGFSAGKVAEQQESSRQSERRQLEEDERRQREYEMDTRTEGPEEAVEMTGTDEPVNFGDLLAPVKQYVEQARAGEEQALPEQDEPQLAAPAVSDPEAMETRNDTGGPEQSTEMLDEIAEPEEFEKSLTEFGLMFQNGVSMEERDGLPPFEFPTPNAARSPSPVGVPLDAAPKDTAVAPLSDETPIDSLPAHISPSGFPRPTCLQITDRYLPTTSICQSTDYRESTPSYSPPSSPVLAAHGWSSTSHPLPRLPASRSPTPEAEERSATVEELTVILQTLTISDPVLDTPAPAASADESQVDNAIGQTGLPLGNSESQECIPAVSEAQVPADFGAWEAGLLLNVRKLGNQTPHNQGNNTALPELYRGESADEEAVVSEEAAPTIPAEEAPVVVEARAEGVAEVATLLPSAEHIPDVTIPMAPEVAVDEAPMEGSAEAVVENTGTGLLPLGDWPSLSIVPAMDVVVEGNPDSHAQSVDALGEGVSILSIDEGMPDGDDMQGGEVEQVDVVAMDTVGSIQDPEVLRESEMVGYQVPEVASQPRPLAFHRPQASFEMIDYQVPAMGGHQHHDSLDMVTAAPLFEERVVDMTEPDPVLYLPPTLPPPPQPLPPPPPPAPAVIELPRDESRLVIEPEPVICLPPIQPPPPVQQQLVSLETLADEFMTIAEQLESKFLQLASVYISIRGWSTTHGSGRHYYQGAHWWKTSEGFWRSPGPEDVDYWTMAGWIEANQTAFEIVLGRLMTAWDDPDRKDECTGVNSVTRALNLAGYEVLEDPGPLEVPEHETISRQYRKELKRKLHLQEEQLRREEELYCPRKLVRRTGFEFHPEDMEVHYVNEEDRYVDENGVRHPYAWYPADGPPLPRDDEAGPFGMPTKRRSRSITGTPARREVDPTVLAAESAFTKRKQEVASLRARSRPKPNAQSYSTRPADQKRPLESGVRKPAQSVPSSNVPTEVIIYGYTRSKQWLAISQYENAFGRICEDYARDAPEEDQTMKLSIARAVAAAEHGPRNKAEASKAMNYAGGEHWIKLTFESAEIAQKAVQEQPLHIAGTFVHCEFWRNTGPKEDAPLYHILRNPSSQQGTQVTPQSQEPRPALEEYESSFSYSNRSNPDSMALTADSATISTTSASFNANNTGGSTRRRMIVPFNNIPANSGNMPTLPRREYTSDRTILRPADEALLPVQSRMERIYSNVLALLPSFLTQDQIGDDLPVTDDGQFDWERATTYWKFWYYIDYYLGTDVLGMKEDQLEIQLELQRQLELQHASQS